MKTILFLSVSIDGYIADRHGIPSFPDGAWQDWCSLANEINSLIAGRSSYEQLIGDESGSLLSPEHKVVLSTRDFESIDESWQSAKSPSEALAVLEEKGVDEVIIGGGRAVAHSFMEAQLVDFIIIDVQPVIFGVGTPLFGDVLDGVSLKLLETLPLNENAIRLKYQVI